jgi:hypothetical protein
MGGWPPDGQKSDKTRRYRVSASNWTGSELGACSRWHNAEHAAGSGPRPMFRMSPCDGMEDGVRYSSKPMGAASRIPAATVPPSVLCSTGEHRRSSRLRRTAKLRASQPQVRVWSTPQSLTSSAMARLVACASWFATPNSLLPQTRCTPKHLQAGYSVYFTQPASGLISG